MSETVSIIGLRDVLKKLKRLKDVPDKESQEMMAEIGEFAIFQILNRTARGVDVNNTAFKPYSPKYALFREEKGLPTDHVDLFFTGMMLSSMTYEATRKKVRIFFQNITDRSDTPVPVKAYFLNEQRQFFSINDKDRQKALKIVERYIRQATRRRA